MVHSEWVGLGWYLRFCIFGHLPGDAQITWPCIMGLHHSWTQFCIIMNIGSSTYISVPLGTFSLYALFLKIEKKKIREEVLYLSSPLSFLPSLFHPHMSFASLPSVLSGFLFRSFSSPILFLYSSFWVYLSLGLFSFTLSLLLTSFIFMTFALLNYSTNMC